MQTINFDELVEKILIKDPRYHRDAYQFLREALEHTQTLAAKRTKGKSRHVSGQELLEGIRQFALSQFGPMTMSVFAEWGIHSGADFGEIVFNLIESKLLSKTDTDSQADFQNGYDFFEAFRKPFLPSSKDSERQSESKAD